MYIHQQFSAWRGEEICMSADVNLLENGIFVNTHMSCYFLTYSTKKRFIFSSRSFRAL